MIVIKTFRNKKDKDLFLNIKQDEVSESPRDWDNMGKMVTFHKRNSFPNEIKLDFENFDSWGKVKEEIENTEDAEIILPVFMLDHSGISLSVKDFNDRWDSGQIGFIFCTKKTIIESYPNIPFEQAKATAKEALIGEIEIYNQYINGDVYFFQVFKKKTCKECGHEAEELGDSCGGFYGMDFKENGLFDQVEGKFEDWEEI